MNIAEFMRLFLINGEIPPTPKDESEKEFLANRGIVYLDDEFERAVFAIFLKSIETDANGLLKLNFELVKEYAKLYEFEFIELCDILSVILQKANNTMADLKK